MILMYARNVPAKIPVQAEPRQSTTCMKTFCLLTLIRLGLSVLLVVSLSVQYPAHLAAALLVFLLASLTDYLDGVIARKWDLVTDFGKLMDPLADKVLTASAFICLIPYQALPAWAVIIIISREFLITGLRLLAGSKGYSPGGETWEAQDSVANDHDHLLPRSAGRDFSIASSAAVNLLWVYGGMVLVTLTVGLTLFSGSAYLWKNRRLLYD